MYTMYIAELIDIPIAMILQMPFIFEDYVILVTKVIDVRLLITPFVASNLYCIIYFSDCLLYPMVSVSLDCPIVIGNCPLGLL